MQTTPFPAYAYGPAFPPADALIDWARRIDWATAADRALTLLLTVAAVVQVLATRARPHVAAALRSLADRVAPEPEPAAVALAPLTVAQLRVLAREHGHPRSAYVSARRADLLSLLESTPALTIARMNATR